MKRFRSFSSRLYTSAGNLRSTAYLYHGDIVNPKDVTINGRPAMNMGKKHGVKILNFTYQITKG